MPKSAAPTTRRLVVIDGNNAIYRAFFAIPSLRSPDGLPTNAAYGFVNILTKVLREEQPNFIAVAWDPRGGSFRKRIFEEYKAGREAQPEDLTAQIPLVKELVDAFEIPLIEVPDFEADDVIATLVDTSGDNTEVVIVSTDKDLMQLVSDRVTLADGVKDRRYRPEDVEGRFGVGPEKMLDWRSLVGDTSDNIPGVKGIGEKGASKLIAEFGTLENLLENAESVKAKRAREALAQHADDARLSKELSQLRSDVDLGMDFEDLALKDPDVSRLRDLYKRLGFTRLLDTLGADLSGVASDLEIKPADRKKIAVEVVEDPQALADAILARPDGERLCVMAVAESGSAVDSLLVGLVFAVEDARALYLPVRRPAGQQSELPGVGDDSGLAPEEIVDALASIFRGASGEAWTGDRVKELQSSLVELGVDVPTPSFDAELAAFLLDSSGAHQLSSLAIQYLGLDLDDWEALAGRGAKATPASQLPTESVAEWAGAQVCATRALEPVLRQALDRDGLQPLFDEVEMPLTAVLSRMERNGVRIDEDRLAELSVEYERDLSRLQEEIYELAGERFLVSSTKQLQVILFEKLNLTPLKKTKTGYSTAEGVLEQLAEEHELPGRILAWRRLSKLKSTYIDALPKLVNEHTGRIHPHFNQTGAATGRLSATEPNVQNIPIRTEEGVRIREAFVPAEGCRLLSADYSQVELRILAHYSDDESLIDAFQRGDDIHRRTAAEVAGIEPEEVDGDQRARAKAVNFGIIYGSSAFGLANQLGIAAGEAQATIDAYFERYKGVARFLEETVVTAKEQGFVTTLLDRRRYLPDLASRNRVLRQAAERMAVNTVIQGTAADLIKKAMVEVHQALDDEGLAARMILQVHDELVFEAPESEIEAVTQLARRCMEGVFSLKVPLVVDVGAGANWREAH